VQLSGEVAHRNACRHKVSAQRNHLRPGTLLLWTVHPTARRSDAEHVQETCMGRGILLWLLGIPIPIIILILLFVR
jgi:hypothetical protein